jgi:Na+-translocating ferredoxin:NAD+ oxidoreductase subunit D
MKLDTQRIMLNVLLALVPGVIAMAYFFGAGIIVNIVVAGITAVATEALMLRARNRSLSTLLDGSALLTAVLLALALPPLLPLWILVAGTAFAIIFGKQLYGGLGHNPFNPAMVGYAALIISFPLAMSTWPALGEPIAFWDMVTIKVMPESGIDAVSGATALDVLKFRGALTIDETWTATNGFGQLAGVGWEWINAGFLVGGIYLLATRTITAMAPLGMLVALTVCAVLFYDSGSSQSLGSPLFHLFSGATMVGAFFIVTDPVSSPDSALGLWIFGLGVGMLTFLLRAIGAYPDGLAFAVLLMNALVPLIDHLRLRRI